MLVGSGLELDPWRVHRRESCSNAATTARRESTQGHEREDEILPIDHFWTPRGQLGLDYLRDAAEALEAVGLSK